MRDILQTGARVPDHGKLNPWYFIIFEGGARAEFGNILRDIWACDHPEATAEQLDHEQNRLTRAPLVIAVISRFRESKIPVWEQILSAGACCYNICLAANLKGYGANWVTEWCAYHPKVRRALNLEDGRDTVAGFLYIGTATGANDERPRPDLDEITNFWTMETAPANKGDIYNKDGLGFADSGFKRPLDVAG